jgi:putative transposase
MVFSPKYRGRVLKGDIAVALENIIRAVCEDMSIEIIDMSISPDHVHLFLRYPPKYSVSKIANRIKGISSRRLRQQFPELRAWCRKGLWARSCFHGAVGHGHDVVQKYIQHQQDYRKRGQYFKNRRKHPRGKSRAGCKQLRPTSDQA